MWYILLMYLQCLVIKMTQCYSCIHCYSNEDIWHVEIVQHHKMTGVHNQTHRMQVLEKSQQLLWIEDRLFCFRGSKHWWQSHDDRKHVTPTTPFSWNQAKFKINTHPLHRNHLELTTWRCSKSVVKNDLFGPQQWPTAQGSCWSPWLWWYPVERRTPILERGEFFSGHGKNHRGKGAFCMGS